MLRDPRRYVESAMAQSVERRASIRRSWVRIPLALRFSLLFFITIYYSGQFLSLSKVIIIKKAASLNRDPSHLLLDAWFLSYEFMPMFYSL